MKKIDGKKLLEMTDEELSSLVTISKLLGEEVEIKINELPIGKVISIRKPGENFKNYYSFKVPENFEVHFNQIVESSSLPSDEGKVYEIYLGHKKFGPIIFISKFQSDEWGFENLFSHHNFGKNYVSGGNFSAGKKIHKTLEEALEKRQNELVKVLGDFPGIDNLWKNVESRNLTKYETITLTND